MERLGESRRLSQREQRAVELEAMIVEGGLEVGEEEATEEPRQNPDGEEESLAGRHPALSVF
jgi:hypothetical protein